ncbi:MAG: winged helix-turn-helix domain-containing protein [Candidatus Freyarchaeum deiterrae]
MKKKNCREMSNEELEAWRKKVADAGLVGNPTEARRSLHVMQSPVRREIMTLLKDKALTIEEIAGELKLEEKTLRFHLQVLERSFFIKIEGNEVDLTPPGVAYTRNVLK